MKKRKSIYSLVAAGVMFASMTTGAFAAENPAGTTEVTGDGSAPVNQTIPVDGKIGPWEGPNIGENNPVDPLPNVAAISVTVPTKMAFQAVSNTTTGTPELASGSYKITNQSIENKVNVSLESFEKQSGDFDVIQGAPTKGNGTVEMNLKLSAKGTDYQIYDGFATPTDLGTLEKKVVGGGDSNSMNLKFKAGDKIETGNDENQADKTFKGKFNLVLKFTKVDA